VPIEKWMDILGEFERKRVGDQELMEHTDGERASKEPSERSSVYRNQTVFDDEWEKWELFRKTCTKNQEKMKKM